MNRAQKTLFKIFAKAVGFPQWSVSDFQSYQNSMRISNGDAYSGASVTGVSALSLSAAWNCINLLCRVRASLPIDIVRTQGGAEVVEDHYLHDLLDVSPNPFMTAFEFHEAMTLNLLISGNAFAQVVKLGKRVTALWPLTMERMRVVMDKGELRYEYTQMDGALKTFAPEEVMHVKLFSIDGITGLSPIAYQREILGKAMAEHRFGATFYRSGGRPSGVLKHPGNLKPEAREKLREDWNRLHSGQSAVAVLWEGMEYQAVSLSMADAQWIQSQRLSVAEIHDIYGVPLDFSATAEHTATYASSEQYNRKFVDYCLASLCKRFEAAYKKSLLSGERDRGIGAVHNLEALLRGDSQAMAQYLSTLAANGLMTRNEARRKLKLPSVKGADDLTVQSNMIDLADLAKVAAGAAKLAQNNQGA